MATEIIKIEDLTQVKNQLETVNRYQQLVQKLLIKGVDYGIIPGTDKYTLFKSGAEKLAKIHGLAEEYEIVKSIEDWDKPFFFYMIKCKMRHIETGMIISEGIGSCNSLEVKYRWKWVYEKELPPMIDKSLLIQKGGKYRVENDEIYTLVNTIAKMAKKRAMVDAVISACRVSATYTQDYEDIADIIDITMSSSSSIEEEKQSPNGKIVEIHNAFAKDSKEEPATPAQKNALQNIIKKFNLKFGLDINTLTKSQASFYIDKLQKEAQEKIKREKKHPSTPQPAEPQEPKQETIDVAVATETDDTIPY